MAVTVTTIQASANLFIADITATADADLTTGNVAHGLGAAPSIVMLTALQALFYLSVWRVSTIDATNLVADKSNVVNSGGAGAQARLMALRPYRMIA